MDAIHQSKLTQKLLNCQLYTTGFSDQSLKWLRENVTGILQQISLTSRRNHEELYQIRESTALEDFQQKNRTYGYY